MSPCMQAYANMGSTTPDSKAFQLAMAEAALERASYESVAQAGWALAVIGCLSTRYLRKVHPGLFCAHCPCSLSCCVAGSGLANAGMLPSGLLAKPCHIKRGCWLLQDCRGSPEL